MKYEELIKYCNVLAQFDTPTISNALECFSDFQRGTGFMKYGIKSVIPCIGTIVGPVATAQIASKNPPTTEESAKLIPYYKHVKDIGTGCIVVHQDMDETPFGSFWGEVNATIHKALGCKGVVTSGGVRDLKEVREIGFGYFAREVLVSHVYAHVIDYNCEVIVGGLKLHPGDIIACDAHGVIQIPIDFLPDMESACRSIVEAELSVLEPCRRAIMRNEIISIEDLKIWRENMIEARTNVRFS